MFKILKSSVRDTAIYSIGTFSSKLAGFILVPLYTNSLYLSETDYGVLNLVEANLQFMISVFGLGLCYAFERWYWDKEFVEKRESIFFTILVATTILSLVLVLTLFPFAGSLSRILFESAAYGNVFQLMLINASFEIVAQTPNSLVRLKEKPSLFTFANMCKLGVSVLCTVIFVVYFKLGLEGVYYAQIIGILVYFIILSKFLYNQSKIGFEWAALRDMVRFRFPFLLPVIALNVFSFNDRFVLSNVSGVIDAGIYSLGAKLANTIKVFLITAIWLALMPTVYRMMNDPQNKRFYSKVMTYLGFVVIIFVMIFSFFGKEMVMLLAKDKMYWDAYLVIPVVSLGIFFAMLKDVSLIGLNITKKTKSIATVTIAITLVNLGLNILLVPYMGMLGAAFSGLIAQFLFFVIIYAVAQKHYKIPYELNKIGLMVLIGLILYGASTITNPLSLWIRVLIKFAMIVLFPFLLYLCGFYEQVEIERIKGFWKKWRNPLMWKKNLDTLEF
ncbi:MAG: oligosaccharide flippase family protein [Chryseolinea sp.]